MGEALIVAGISHRSAAAALRDAVFIPEAELPDFDAALAARGIGRALVLSTCDRIEVQAAHDDPGGAAAAIHDLLRTRAPLPPDALYAHEGADALRHVFAVAASLDSQIVGEPQVLGQVKAAHARARAAGRMGGLLDATLQAAFAAAKRVRTETAIGERPVSLAAAAIQLGRDVHGDLAQARLALVGAGDMGEALAESFREAGLRRMVAASPSEGRARETAQRLGCHVAPLDDTLLAGADILVTAAGTGRVLVGADAVRAALRRRRAPMLIVDLGVPPDVDPAIDRIDDVFRYDLDDLERIALSGRLSREEAARAAWAILDAEVDAFAQARAERGAVPAIAALRARVDALRRAALAEAGGDAARATELLANRLLHAPAEALRRRAAAGESPASLEALLRELFGSDTEPP